MIGAFNTRCGGFVWREKMGWQGLRHSAGDGSFRRMWWLVSSCLSSL